MASAAAGAGAPTATVDLGTASGAGSPTEGGAGGEGEESGGQRVAPPGIRVWNPAFDVTPHGLSAAIGTGRGVHRAPYAESLLGAMAAT